MKRRVVVVGGGAAGLMAAYAAADEGANVILLEKNEKLGKKIYITGKGRCNVTNDCLPEEYLQNVVRGESFMRGAIRAFSPEALISFFEEQGLMLKTERGNRVFPVSDHASDITKTLQNACERAGVTIELGENVTEIDILHSNMPDIVYEIFTQNGVYTCDALIIATGGLSYPSTGSTGDGYRFAKRFGHSIEECRPSLTGLNLKGDFSDVQGISLKNVVLSASRNGKVIFSEMGELLFTHFGISGPLVLSLSALINRLPLSEVSLSLDLKPALDEEKLDLRLVRDFTERRNEQMKNVIRGLLPKSVGLMLLKQAKLSQKKQANAVTKEERACLVALLKRFPFSIESLRGYDEAIITSGGVSLREISSKTMESKFMSGLYFCGEVLDVDCFTGGFNLQTAFSTGYVAGTNAARFK